MTASHCDFEERIAPTAFVERVRSAAFAENIDSRPFAERVPSAHYAERVAPTRYELVGGAEPVRGSAPAVDVGADQATTGTAAVSAIATGSPAPTLLWTMTSGPGTATFDDDTAASATATFSLSGAYVLRCTATNAIGSGYDELTVTVTLSESYIFGSALYGLYRFVSDNVTLATGISALLDESTHSNTLTQSTPSLQPAWVSSGGPGNAPFLRMTSSPGSSWLDRSGIAGAPSAGGVSSIFLVARRYQSTSGQARGVGVAAAAENPLRHYVGSQGNAWYTETPTAQQIAHTDGPWVVLSRYTTASKTAFALDGVDGWSGSRVLHTSTPTFMRIGHPFGGFDIDLARVVFVAGDITQTQHDQMISTLQAVYGL